MCQLVPNFVSYVCQILFELLYSWESYSVYDCNASAGTAIRCLRSYCYQKNSSFVYIFIKKNSRIDY